MCGRFAQQRPASELAEIFGAEPLADELGERFNVAPTDPALVVAQRDERRAIVAWSWGLVPHWAAEAPRRPPPFNARAETLERSPLFAESFRRRRCLVPVDAFYEWRRLADGSRQPHAIRRADRRPLALAGIWAGARLPSGEIRRTFAIVTSPPNAAVAPLHDRMPVVVPEAAWGRWLDRTAAVDGELRGLFEPDESLALDIYPVGRLVNSVRNDGPELLEPVGA
ncbi:MAG TPA: SOS response-associated peptidase [Candidatus Limnocylindrales bacterium]|nr:SOS response-associated peptidase [Candidatus Limnocylindrales bacterium]